MRSSRRFRRLGAQGRSTSFLLAAYSGGPLVADRPPAAGADRRLRRGTGGPTGVEPRFRIRAYPTADRYLRRSTLRIALSETTPVSSSFPEPNRLDAVASVANWAAVSIPPGS